MNIRVTKTTHPMELTPSDKLGFGIHYTDHMFIMDYSDEKGWHDARIVPFQDISLSPAACVFHYGAEVFEGLKAYRRKDGKVQLFRPWDNMERMKNSKPRRWRGHDDSTISSSSEKPEKSTVLKKFSTPSMSLVISLNRPSTWHSDSCAASAKA